MTMCLFLLSYSSAISSSTLLGEMPCGEKKDKSAKRWPRNAACWRIIHNPSYQLRDNKMIQQWYNDTEIRFRVLATEQTGGLKTINQLILRRYSIRFIQPGSVVGSAVNVDVDIDFPLEYDLLLFNDVNSPTIHSTPHIASVHSDSARCRGTLYRDSANVHSAFHSNRPMSTEFLNELPAVGQASCSHNG